MIYDLDATRKQMIDGLLAKAEGDGHWEGKLATSALSTATAVVALTLVDRETYKPLINDGLNWLARNANRDGGWGDTVRSGSNVSTTLLCWGALCLDASASAAMSLAGKPASVSAGRRFAAREAAEGWLRRDLGGLDSETIAAGIMARYADDHTFSVPILTMLALCGCLGEGHEAWRHVIRLPFEMAALPRRFFSLLRMPVVSYALPALIAIGQAIDFHKGSGNPISGVLRKLTRNKTLAILDNIQPENGGFLEAVPLTSFVTMSLASINLKDHPVVRRGVSFLVNGVRADGSWPIDTHLATWLTTLSVNALHDDLPRTQAESIKDWLFAQQYKTEHPYTGAGPGGWSWTPLPGGVPDADDTSGALIALARLNDTAHESAHAGLNWLAGLQNRDGGIPTFCRGWGHLPFDTSCPDISAHTYGALMAWREQGIDNPTFQKMGHRILTYLENTQAIEGYWLPLWFGNEHVPQNANPVYGTARVLSGLQTNLSDTRVATMVAKARKWLIQAVNTDKGWGGDKGAPSSIEETALTITALCEGPLDRDSSAIVQKGLQYLAQETLGGTQFHAAPIGFYFANLWYFEELYPHIFSVGAFQAAFTNSNFQQHLEDINIPV